MRIVRAITNRTKAATASNTMSVTTTNLLLVDERRGALDLGDFDLRPGLEHLTVHVRPRRPLLAADPHAASVGVHTLQNRRLRADERGGAGANHRGHVEVGTRDRAEYCDGSDGARDEDDHLDRRVRADGGDDRSGDRGDRYRPEEEQPRRQYFTDRKHDRDDRPDHPARHVT